MAKTGLIDPNKNAQLPELLEPIPVRSAPGPALSYREEGKVSVLSRRKKKKPCTAKEAAQGRETKKGGLRGGEKLKKE